MNSGLYKLLHPIIPNERIWSKLGEHGEHRESREHGKNGKHQPDYSKHSIYDSKHLWLKHSFWQSDDSNTLFCGFYVDSRKIITYALGEHDPGSPKNGRTSSEVPAPCLYFSSVSKLCNPISLLAALVMANRCHTTNHPELRKIVTVISSAAINF